LVKAARTGRPSVRYCEAWLDASKAAWVIPTLEPGHVGGT
jgi:hypothetical protein